MTRMVTSWSLSLPKHEGLSPEARRPMTTPDSNGQNLPREPPVVGDEIETPATRLSRTTMNVGGVHDAHTVEAGPPTGHKRRHRGVPGVQPVIARRRSASMNTPGSASSKLVIQHDIGSDVSATGWHGDRSTRCG